MDRILNKIHESGPRATRGRGGLLFGIGRDFIHPDKHLVVQDNCMRKCVRVQAIYFRNKTGAAILITKNIDDYGLVSHPTQTRIVKIPAFAFLYLLGHAEHESYIR
jgi:hypothetical protein